MMTQTKKLLLSLSTPMVALIVLTTYKGAWANMTILWSLGLLLFVTKGLYWAWLKKRSSRFEFLIVLFIFLVSFLFPRICNIGVAELDQSVAPLVFVSSGLTLPLILMSKGFFAFFLWMGIFLMGIFLMGRQIFFPLVIPSAFLMWRVFQQTGVTRAQIKAVSIWTLVMLVFVLFSIIESSKYVYLDNPLWSPTLIPLYLAVALSAHQIWTKLQYPNNSKYLLLAVCGLYLIPFHLIGKPVSFLPYVAISSAAILLTTAVFLWTVKLKKTSCLFLLIAGLAFSSLFSTTLGMMSLIEMIVAGIFNVLVTM